MVHYARELQELTVSAPMTNDTIDDNRSFNR